ncbi:hypothetical protein SISSUDRAFT_1058615 [Sistotremastrum suecicum HHB10207 ss-3]|uniref:Uncharacterized protein n=1 Tax=Sistotremastrum suecicum HHB10207 ss-3 TaxID=1314776 RepID=A0A166HBJ8_9AGAM|nr:hypothetical protein SISSUDRAFT_1058615 [Sistotremastrum suecicum HHB10207 ss-3]
MADRAAATSNGGSSMVVADAPERIVKPPSRPPSPPQSPLFESDNPLNDSSFLIPDSPPSLAVDPPPPYRDRRVRHGTLRTSRRTQQPPISSEIDELDPGLGDTETAPLLTSRRRTISHSSLHSTHSIAHTIFTFFHAENGHADMVVSETLSRKQRAIRYFRPLRKRMYYAALFHLLIINFPYALFVWIYLFAATITGTATLITLPLGAVFCWLNLLGGRFFALTEISLQCRFHGPLSIQPPTPPHPLFKRLVPSAARDLEGQDDVVYVEQSFLRNSYDMFTDPVSYQNLFYFLVVKPALTLLIFVGLLVIVPPAFILVIPAPAVLRLVRKIGIFQANVALDGLS